MAKVELKQPVVDEIKGVLEGAVGAVIVDYRGLTVEQDTQLRKKLREAGVTYKVFKNTLIKRAAEGTEFAALEPQLEGPTALAVSKEDATAPARILAEFDVYKRQPPFAVPGIFEGKRCIPQHCDGVYGFRKTLLFFI